MYQNGEQNLSNPENISNMYNDAEFLKLTA